MHLRHHLGHRSGMLRQRRTSEKKLPPLKQTWDGRVLDYSTHQAQHEHCTLQTDVDEETPILTERGPPKLNTEALSPGG